MDKFAQDGMKWWNAVDESTRRYWCSVANSARPADAYQAYLSVDTSLQLAGVDLPPLPPKKRGRPVTGAALDNAARSKAKRERLQAGGKKQISVTLSLDLIEAIHKHVEFKDMTLGDACEKALRGYFLRKR